MKRCLLLALAAFCCAAAWANGDPVIEYSAMTLSRTPVERRIPEIQITHERLDITPGDMYTHVTARYRLHNTSNRTFRNIRYGFPIDWYGTADSLYLTGRDGWTESLREVGWRDDYVTAVSFALNGRKLRWQQSADTLLHNAHSEEIRQLMEKEEAEAENEELDYYIDSYDYENRLNRRWYYTMFTIRAHATVELTVSYTLANSYLTPLYERGEVLKDALDIYSGNYSVGDYTSQYNLFSYDFSPAAAWGNGHADSLEVNVCTQAVRLEADAPNYDGLANFIEGFTPDTLPNGNLQFRARNFDYASAGPMHLKFMAKHKVEENLDYLFSHRLTPDNYTITVSHGDASASLTPLSDLDFTTAAQIPFSDTTEIVIRFHEPTFVSGLVLLNGWQRDSLSWASSPKISMMKVWKPNADGYTYPIFCKQEPIVKWIKFAYHPAPCRLVAPQEFTWKEVIAKVDKMNVSPLKHWIVTDSVGTRLDLDPTSGWGNDYPLTSEIHIVISGVTAPTSATPNSFMLSEIILLTASPDESAFGTLIYDPSPYDF